MADDGDRQDPAALVIGEAVLDVVRGRGAAPDRRPGGSAVNTAVALARLDRPVVLASSWADDADGALVAAHLHAAGVGLAGDPLILERTSRADAEIGADGAARYDFAVSWRLPAGVAAVVPHHLHVTSLAPLLAPGADDVLLVVERLARTTSVSYDLNLRPDLTGTGPDVVDRVTRLLRHTDLVKASDEDLAALWPELTPGEAATRLIGLGAVAVVVTHGGDGASWHAVHGADWSAGGVHAPAVDVVDTIGAGDTFAAALLDHLWPVLGAGGRARLSVLGPDQWSAALDHACRVAAVTVGRVGADPPHRAELPSLPTP